MSQCQLEIINHVPFFLSGLRIALKWPGIPDNASLNQVDQNIYSFEKENQQSQHSLDNLISIGY